MSKEALVCGRTSFITVRGFHFPMSMTHATRLLLDNLSKKEIFIRIEAKKFDVLE